MMRRNWKRTTFFFGERYTEGRYLKFTVTGHIISESGQRFFVLLSRFKNRLLIPSDTYESFGIMIGVKVKCRVDKINCSGRILLEPMHGHFVANYRYPLKVVEECYITDHKGRKHKLHRIHDANRQLHLAFLYPDDGVKAGDFISGWYEGSRKGKLFFRVVEVINNC